VLPHLPSTFRTVAISQRGHGDSDKPEGGYTVRDFAADLKALLDALAIERAVIAGHSSASIVARRFALDYPERIAGLVLEGSFVKLPEGAAQFGVRVASLEDPVSQEFARNFVTATFGRPVPTEFLDAMIEESLKAPARVWRETFASLLDYDDSAEAGQENEDVTRAWAHVDVREVDVRRERYLGRSGMPARVGAVSVGHRRFSFRARRRDESSDEDEREMSVRHSWSRRYRGVSSGRLLRS
jgi:pimeloyl-ACP methyl ester carboxylesterase